MPKLVRDKMPGIWNSAKKEFKIHTADDKEFDVALRAKIFQEAQEAVDAQTKDKAISEMATIIECVDEYLKLHKTTKEEFENKRKEKNEKMGSFSKKTIVED